MYDLSEEISRSKRTKSTTSRSSSTASSSAPTSVAPPDGFAARRPRRSRAVSLSQISWPDDRDIALLAELRLRGLRHLHRRADAAHVLVQQPVRRVPDVHGPRHAAQGSTPSSSSRTRAFPCSTARSAPSGWNNVRGDGISRMYFEALAKKYHFSLRDACGRALQRGHGRHSLRHEGREAGAPVRPAATARAVLYQAFEGIIPNLERRYKRDAERRRARRS